MVSGDLERSWRQRYDRWATAYNADHLVAGWSEEGLSRRLALVLRLVADVLKPGSKILDLGAGPGTYTRALKSLGHNCLGLDYSRNVVGMAKAKDSAGTYVQAEAYHLPFTANAFGAIVCVGVLQSLQSIQQALLEMHRVLKPGGWLFLDGLNGLFWLHVVRSVKESLTSSEKRMNYYHPFRLAEQLAALDFCDPRVHWLAMPERFQGWLTDGAQRGLCFLPRLFGYSFLISARKR